MRLIEWINKFNYLENDIPVAIHLDPYTIRSAFVENRFKYEYNMYVGSMENIPMWLGSYYVVDNMTYIENGQLNIFISARNEEHF